MKTPEEIKKALRICSGKLLDYCDACNYCNWSSDCACNSRMCADALDYIQQLENQIGELTEKVAQLEAAQPKWISVDERLPEQFVSVLVYMPDEYPCPTVHEGYLRPDGKWDAAHYTRTPDEVTHWANMPEPPKEDA